LKPEKRFICVSLLVMLLAGTGCMKQEQDPPSAIVQTAQKAGSGDLSNVSTQAMEQWLGKHRDTSVQIENMCKNVRQNATAQWNDSTEGRLCAAAHDLAFFRSAPVTGDGKAFRPGTH